MVLAAGLLPPSLAAEPIACTAATAGQLSVQAGTSCACRYFRGGTMTDEPAGYRWDCGILRPSMTPDVPVDLNRYDGPLPDALSIEAIPPPEPMR